MAEHKVIFKVEVLTSEKPTQTDIDRMAHFTAQALNRTFGAQRFTIWHKRRKFIFRPEDADHGMSSLDESTGRWTDA